MLRSKAVYDRTISGQKLVVGLLFSGGLLHAGRTILE
jgi:hypothetical protein